jgi:hypothetical protein
MKGNTPRIGAQSRALAPFNKRHAPPTFDAALLLPRRARLETVI